MRASCIVMVEAPERAGMRNARSAGPGGGHGIDAGVKVKPPVLFEKEGLSEGGGDLGKRRPETVLVVGGEGDAEEFAICRPDRSRERDAARERFMRPETQKRESGEHRR